MRKARPRVDVRGRDLAIIHIAKKDLCLDDATYRDMLWTIARVRTSADLDFAGRNRVIDHLKAKGWKPTAASRRRTGRHLADDAQNRMIRGLWIDLHEAGKVENASEEALAAFCKRVTGVDALQWTSPAQRSSVIEALKAWTRRS